MAHLPILIILIPLSAALISLALSRISLKLGKCIIFVAMISSTIVSVMLLMKIMQNGTWNYTFGGYDIPYSIEFVIDSLSALIILLINIIGVLTLIFCTNFEDDRNNLLSGGSYTMLMLLIVGLIGMSATGDMFNLYVFLEVTSLSGYCLIALGGSRAIVATFRYMLVGTVAATFYLLGVGILYANTGTLNMGDMADILSTGKNNSAMAISLCFLIVGFGIKMALFPFHGWQPAAYTHAHPGSRPLIAGVMGKIPAFAMFKYIFIIYGKNFIYLKYFLIIIGAISVIGILYGSIRAMGETDIRKIFAYSSITQIGYISLGFAIGNKIALAGAFLHMIGHAFMKSGLFFASGAIRYKYGIVNLDYFGRIYKKMPMTATLIVVASLSMVGIPPTVGFFSKWYLVYGAVQKQEYIYLIALIISSLLNAVYFFRLLEKIYIESDKSLTDISDCKRELPITMIIPISACFIFIILLGIFNVRLIDIILNTVAEVAI